MAGPRPRDILDPTDTWWTIDEAAEHFGMKRRTVQRYIREGLPAYGTQGDYVNREQFLAEWRRRHQNKTATHYIPAISGE